MEVYVIVIGGVIQYEMPTSLSKACEIAGISYSTASKHRITRDNPLYVGIDNKHISILVGGIVRQRMRNKGFAKR